MPKSSILDDISAQCTALERGQRLGERAATVGFDWPEPAEALAKVHEEVAELEEVLAAQADSGATAEHGYTEQVADELGDILFALVNVARKLDVDAEEAMERTNRKFVRRFRFIEEELARQGRRLDEVGLDEMEALWQKAKR